MIGLTWTTVARYPGTRNFHLFLTSCSAYGNNPSFQGGVQPVQLEDKRGGGGGRGVERGGAELPTHQQQRAHPRRVPHPPPDGGGGQPGRSQGVEGHRAGLPKSQICLTRHSGEVQKIILPNKMVL